MLCNNLKFLVVEDHPIQKRLVMALLRSFGADAVHGADDGASALLVLQDAARPVDIVLLDLSMPGMDGVELLRSLSGKNPVSIILHSALGPALLATLTRLAVDYKVRLLGAISKPLTPDSLAPLIALHHAEVLPG